jgi:membrane-bound lytic murein transglycosylase MltF
MAVSRVRRTGFAHFFAMAILVAMGCGEEDATEDRGTHDPAEARPLVGDPGMAGTTATPEPTLAQQVFHTPAAQELPPGLARLAEPWTGDMDGMVERRLIRFLTVYAPETYYLDGREQSGVTFELARRFEESINASRDPSQHVYVVLIPVRRDQLLPAVEEGIGDIAAANLTVTPQRLQRVDFSSPVLEGVREVVAMGPGSPPLATLDDLAGAPVYVRESSSYWEHLGQLGEAQERRGLAPVHRVALDESLEDHDALQMVATGLIPFTIVDDHVGRVWAQVLPDLELREDLAVSEGRAVAWAFRKGSPQLEAVVDEFLTTHRRGTLVGNVLLRRYGTQTRARRVMDEPAVARPDGLVDVFQEYGRRFDIPWEVLAAMAYQESGLDPDARSSAGAVGIMQLMPSTAAEVGVTNPATVDGSVHAAAAYLDRLRGIYLDEPGLDRREQALLMLASYNAGPNRIRQLRREAAVQGLDPDVWFDNVELVTARRVGRETVEYVSNVFKYYIAFRQIAVGFVSS